MKNCGACLGLLHQEGDSFPGGLAENNEGLWCLKSYEFEFPQTVSLVAVH